MTGHAWAGASRRFLFVAALEAILSTRPAAAATVTFATASDLADVARSLPKAASMRIEGATLDGRSSAAGLDLVRFEPVADGARFVVQAADGPHAAKPALPAYYRGAVDGILGSIAVLSVHADGEIRGVISSSDATWMLSRSGTPGAALHSRRAERDKVMGTRKFDCEVLPNPNPRPAATPGEHVLRLPMSWTAQVAVELDYDYYLTFAPDTDAAMLYALDLLAFTGSLGESELGMTTQVPFVQLWTTSTDPYSGGLARLDQMRDRWNAFASTNCGGLDCTAIHRTTVILLSSAPTGGVAYLPGMCDSWTDPAGGVAYAYAGSIDGVFDIDAPTAVWDIMVTAHELGHSFGSAHTHCYSPPIDGCYNAETGCFAGSEALPSGCPGKGQHCGTLMSYCHLQSGGMTNISLTYGAGFGYGVDPGRVPAAMIAEIANTDAAVPGCLTAAGGLIELTVSKSGSGDGTVSISPASTDCSAGCRTYLDSGTVVTLTATPGPFSQFGGWSGDADCSDGVVTLSAATSCVANFTGNCGVGNDNCDDHDPCTEDSCPADDHCVNLSVPRDPGLCYAAGRAALRITNSPVPGADKMTWQWSAGEAFAEADLGDPSSTTNYRVCMYDSTADVTRLAGSMSILGGSPYWKNMGTKGWSWKDTAGSFGGIRKLQLKAGTTGMTKVMLSAGGSSLVLPMPFSGSEFFDEDSSVIVQLFAGTSTCWSASFTAAGTSGNSPAGFKASGN